MLGNEKVLLLVLSFKSDVKVFFIIDYPKILDRQNDMTAKK